MNNKQIKISDGIRKYCEKWLHFEQNLNFRGPRGIFWEDLEEPGSAKFPGPWETGNRELLVRSAMID